MQGKKVCVIDLDPQHNLSKHFGVFPGYLKNRPTIYDLLHEAIEMYQKSIQKFIDSGGTSPTVIERWIKKINALNQKKSTYEDILRQRLDNLDKDYALLKMQAQELIVRNNNSQLKMPLAA